MKITVRGNLTCLVVHGAIDGFSRLPVYLQCSDNNYAPTVLRCFIAAYGLPVCDQGVENYDAAM